MHSLNLTGMVSNTTMPTTQSDARTTNNPVPESPEIESPVSPMESETSPSSESPTDNDPQVGDKRMRSPAWKTFKRIKVNGVEKAECTYCKKHLGATSKNGTKHLLDHQKICKIRPNKGLSQQTLIQQQWKADGKMALSNYVFNPEVSRRDLAEMIIVHEYPMAIVDHYTFRKYSSNLQPLFSVPSRSTVKRDIMKIYGLERSDVMSVLKKNSSRIEITTDMWTTSNHKKGYMAITTHYIDAEWKMQSLIMRFVYVPCPHTADALSKELLNCIFDWNLERKLSTLTVDNCTTNDSIIDKLVCKLNRSNLLLRGELFHMRCCAHILNLIVQDGLKVIGDAIERVRDSVAYWLATRKRQQTFRENVSHLGIKSSKQLVLDCKTR